MHYLQNMFSQFNSMKSSLNILLQYTQNLEENIQTLYTKLVTNHDNQKTYKAPQCNLTYVSLLTPMGWITIDIKC